MPDLPHENKDDAGEEEELPNPQELVDKARALSLSTDGLTAGLVSLRSAEKARASSISAMTEVLPVEVEPWRHIAPGHHAVWLTP